MFLLRKNVDSMKLVFFLSEVLIFGGVKNKTFVEKKIIDFEPRRILVFFYYSTRPNKKLIIFSEFFDLFLKGIKFTGNRKNSKFYN